MQLAIEKVWIDPCILQHTQVEKLLSFDQMLKREFPDQHSSLRQTGGQIKNFTFHPPAVYAVATAMLYYWHFYDFVPLLLSVENNYAYSTVWWSNRWKGPTAWQCQTQVCHECLCTHGTPVPGNNEGILSCHQNWSPAWRQDRSFPAQARKKGPYNCRSLRLWNTKSWWVTLRQQMEKRFFATKVKRRNARDFLPHWKFWKWFYFYTVWAGSVCGPWLLQQGIPQVQESFHPSSID